MNYREAREQIKNGDLLLFHSDGGLYARAIALRTGSTYVHCAIAWRAFGRLLLVEALTRPGVAVQPLSLRIDRGARIDWFSLDDHCGIDRGAVVHHALAQWGEPYASPWQLFKSFVLPARFRRGPADVDADRWFCSELALSSLHAGGYRPHVWRDPATVAPATLACLPILERRAQLERTSP